MHADSTYPVPEATCSHELVVKKSRFIGLLTRIDSLEKMNHFLSEVRKLHPKANHYCWAAAAGAPLQAELQRYSDDGEPAGTAGKPILNVLAHAGVGRTGVIVARYFGGIKLGKGGLVRAYGDTATVLLQKAVWRNHFDTVRVVCTIPYKQENAFRHLLKSYRTTSARYRHAEYVEAEIHLNSDQLESYLEEINDHFRGEVICHRE